MTTDETGSMTAAPRAGGIKASITLCDERHDDNRRVDASTVCVGVGPGLETRARHLGSWRL
jgi:hypothetical protein